MSDVKVKFGAEDENMTATLKKVKTGLKDIDGQAEKTTKGFDAGFKTIAAGAAAGALAVKAAGAAMRLAMDGARAVVDKFGEALKFGGKMDDMSKSTGVAARELVVLERVFDNAGVGGEKLGQKINRMQRFIEEVSDGTKTYTDITDKLGLSYEDLKGKTPTEQLKVLSNALANVSDPGTRAALSMEIFGGRTADMIPLITSFDDEITRAEGQVGTFADVIGRSHGKFDALNDNLAAVKSKTMEFAAGLLEKALPSLTKFVDMLTKVDAAGWGGRLMEVIGTVGELLIGAFKAPNKAVDLLKESLVWAAKAYGNNLLNGLVTFKNAFVSFWESEIPKTVARLLADSLLFAGTKYYAFMFRKFDEFVEHLRNGFGSAFEDPLKFLSKGLSNVVKSFASDFMQAWGNPAAFVAGKIGGALIDASTDGAKTFAAEYGKSSGTVIGKIAQGLEETADKYGKDIVKGQENLRNEFGKMVADIEVSTEDFFGAKPQAEKVVETAKGLIEVSKKFREEFEKTKDVSYDMRRDFKESSDHVKQLSFAMFDAEGNAVGVNNALANAADPLKEDTSKAKDDMQQIMRIGDIIKARDKAPPMMNFRDQVKQARKDLGDISVIIGKDLSKMALPDIAEQMGIDRTKKDSKELFDEIKARIEAIKNTNVKLNIGEDWTQEDWQKIIDKIGEIEYEAGKPKDLALNADKSIERIKDEMKKEVDIALQSSEGTKILETMKTAVEMIRDTVKLIEPKLPQRALI